jgi:DNA polymerase-3 subunit beta
VQVPGSAILQLSRFGPILRESSDEQLRLEADGQGTIVRGARSEFKLPGENPAEFPSVADFNEAKYHELPARLLRELIRRTTFATDNESSRYALGGVLLEFGEQQIIAVGTDGRRLAKMEVPAQSIGGHQTGDSMTIVPAKAMQLIERALTDGDAEIQVAARANEILVRSPRATIYSRLVEGRFPKWRDVLPQRSGTQKIELKVGALHSAVRQAAIITSEESRGVDFTFQDGTLILSGRAAEVGQSRVELPIGYDGPAISITLDPRYVNDFLKVLDPERNFTLDLKDAESAAVGQTDDGYAYVIMPLARDR